MQLNKVVQARTKSKSTAWLVNVCDQAPLHWSICAFEMSHWYAFFKIIVSHQYAHSLLHFEWVRVRRTHAADRFYLDQRLLSSLLELRE